MSMLGLENWVELNTTEINEVLEALFVLMLWGEMEPVLLFLVISLLQRNTWTSKISKFYYQVQFKTLRYKSY